jgi:hypothetical protein
MPRVAPATRLRLVEALSGLHRLRREMARLSQGDKTYESKKRALQVAKIKKMAFGGCLMTAHIASRLAYAFV